MPIGLGGAIFDTDGGAGLQRAASQIAQYQNAERQQQRYEQRIDRENAVREQRQQRTNQNVIDSLVNDDSYTVNDLYQPYVTDQLEQIRLKYTKMNREGTLDPLYIQSMMRADLSKLGTAAQGFKAFGQALKDTAKEYKDYGFSPQDVERVVKQGIFYETDSKGTKRLKPLSSIDFEDAAMNVGEVLRSQATGLGPGNVEPIAKRIQSRQLNSETGKITVSDKDASGRKTSRSYTGTVQFDPLFDTVSRNDAGEITGVAKRTQQYVNENGQPYIDPVTKTTAAPVIATDAYEYLYNGDKRTKWYIDTTAEMEANKLREQGVQLGFTDVDYLRKKVATNLLESHSNTKFGSTQVTSDAVATQRASSGGSGSRSGGRNSGGDFVEVTTTKVIPGTKKGESTRLKVKDKIPRNQVKANKADTPKQQPVKSAVGLDVNKMKNFKF